MNTTRRFFIFILALLITALIALFACSNSQSNTPSPQPVRPTFTPFTPAPHFNVTIPQKGLLKNYLTVSVEAFPGTNCTLTFVPPSGDTQVMEAVANADGECVWRWKLEESYGKGDGRLIFTINGVSDTHFIEIRENF